MLQDTFPKNKSVAFGISDSPNERIAAQATSYFLSFFFPSKKAFLTTKKGIFWRVESREEMIEVYHVSRYCMWKWLSASRWTYLQLDTTYAWYIHIWRMALKSNEICKVPYLTRPIRLTFKLLKFYFTSKKKALLFSKSTSKSYIFRRNNQVRTFTSCSEMAEYDTSLVT